MEFLLWYATYDYLTFVLIVLDFRLQFKTVCNLFMYIANNCLPSLDIAIRRAVALLTTAWD